MANVPPHVVVLRAVADEISDIADHARLAMAHSPGGGTETLGDQSALDDLDEGARLFVAGWRSRGIEKPDRLGEALAWDHPGFQAPDRPPD